MNETMTHRFNELNNAAKNGKLSLANFKPILIESVHEGVTTKTDSMEATFTCGRVVLWEDCCEVYRQTPIGIVATRITFDFNTDWAKKAIRFLQNSDVK